MSTPHPTYTEAALIAELREIDRQLWPSVDRVLARHGLTRADLEHMTVPSLVPPVADDSRDKR
jgi:hypothetical protein